MEGIIIKNLCKSYVGKKGRIHTAIQDIHLHWHAGECISLLGESGCGKSTLAKIMLGMERPDSGSITMDGIELTTLGFSAWKQQRKRLQGVFQDASGTMNPRRSVYANIEEAMVNVTDWTATERKTRILEMMASMGLSETLLYGSVRQLSGGEQRRFALLKAMSVQPKYLILDEPTSGLDLVCANAVLQMLSQCRKETNCAILFITHDLHSAYQISDRMIQMQAGRLVLEGIK